MSSAAPLVLHATAVAVDGRGLLIRGASGSGKSGLALDLIALGARLIADDRTELRRVGDSVLLDCPPAIRGRIEARGVGILSADPVRAVPLRAVVDLDTVEPHRLPEPRRTECLGLSFPLFHKAMTPHFSAAILIYMRSGGEEGS